MSEKLRDVDIPQTIDDALRVAKSLVCWLEWIKDNGSMSSNGGWIDLHFSALSCWLQKEKIESSAKSLSNSLKELETIANEKMESEK